jgi:Phosphotransferase enzyme family
VPDPLAPRDVARVLAIAAPSAEIVAWEVTPDAYPVLTPSTEALGRVSATTADGSRVRVFVKTIRSMRHWPAIGMLPPDQREAAISRFPWRTEALVYGSSLVRDLPVGMRAPRVYAVDDLGDDRVRIWMEDVPAASVAWDDAGYAAAARALGRLAARVHRDGLPPDAPPLYGGLRMLWSMRISTHLVSAVRDEATWRHPLLAAVAEVDPGLRGDLLTLAIEAPAILDQLDRLPRGLSHGDACPQNLLADPDLDGGFVAIDWGFTAMAPLGTDLVQLLAGRADSAELDPTAMPHVEEVIVAGFLAGLAGENVAVDPAAVRAAFTGGLLVGKAFSALPVERLGGQLPAPTPEFVLQRARYARFILDHRELLAANG